QILQAGEESELPVTFEVTEPAVGQYEYEIHVTAFNGESDTENNSALTFLNVIDQQIQVLFVEGEPYWDTTFLQRSLMRNEKVNVDSITLYAEGKARTVRKTPNPQPLRIPGTLDEWKHYDIVVLGRSVDKVVGENGIPLLEAYVKTAGGTIVFRRGRAFGEHSARTDLEPVTWGNTVSEHIRLQVSREGQSIAPFRVLAAEANDPDKVPELIAARAVVEKKPLAASLAATVGTTNPGMIHRQVGSGQVL